MKKIILDLLIIITIVVLGASQDSLLSGDKFAFYNQGIDVYLKMQSNISVVGSTDQVKNLNVKLFQFPKNSSVTQLKYLNFFPETVEKTDKYIKFKFINVYHNNPFGLNSKIHSLMFRNNIENSVDFPIKELDNSFLEYLKFYNKTNINQEIRNKASQIVSKKTNLLDAVVSIADFVSNRVEYSATPVTENQVKDSVWTYNNKIGVCDEITSLFISMVRAIGIPARFVSGIAYTNQNSINDYGNHAWAEVYFPDYGWIPFDVTYREFAWLDATHIPLAKNLDSESQTLKTSMISSGAKLVSSSLNINATTETLSNKSFPDISLNVKPRFNKISHNSYNIVEARVHNNGLYYQVFDVFLTNVDEMNIISKNPQTVVIPPKKTKKIYWIIHVNISDTENSYKFPINIYTQFNKTALSDFVVSKQGLYYSKSFISNVFKTEEYNSSFDVDCYYSDFIINKSQSIMCSVHNKLKKSVQAKICFLNECKLVDFDALQTKNISFDVVFNDLGLITIPVIIDDNEKHYFNINVIDEPNISINLSYDNETEFNKVIFINALLKINSVSRPKNVTINISSKVGKQVWRFDELEQNQLIRLKINSKDLLKKTDFDINVSWSYNGINYKTSKHISIYLKSLNIWQKLYILIHRLLIKL